MVPPILSATQSQTQSGAWTPFQRWALRVTFIYFLLDALPDLLIKVPGGPAVLLLYWKAWNPVLSWFGRSVLHAANPDALPLPTGPVLLGDFAGGYVLMLLFLVIALALGSVWTVFEPWQGSDHTLHTWLRIYVRFALAFSMLGYGLSKLFSVQFRSLDLVDWMTPLGMLQPRELLWGFMGFSRSYQVFTGIVESVGVALLFWRRTTPIGSLLLMGALGNVLMLDISYGVQVRRVVLRLLLMALFLAVADILKLARLFLMRQPVAPPDLGEAFPGPVWMRGLAGAAKAIVIVYLLTSQSVAYSEERKLVAAPHPDLYGVYRVQQFLRDGQDVEQDDVRRWVWVAIDGRTFAVERSDASWERGGIVADDENHVITVSRGPRQKSTLRYSRGEGGQVILAGLLEDTSTEIHLQRIPEPQFPLNDDRLLRWPSIW